MVRHGGVPGLRVGANVLPWSFNGYGVPIAVSPTTRVELLTPPAVVAAITAGYRPLVHPSARGATLEQPGASRTTRFLTLR
jgi:hypothetical protein